MAESGGAALKQAIHVARAKAGITSDVQLALRAHVHYDTLMNWFGDKGIPRGFELKKVAKALGVHYWELQAAYDGEDPQPQPLQDAIRDLAGQLGQQTAAITSLVDELRLARAEHEGMLEGIERGLRVAASIQEAVGQPASNGPPSRADTAR